LEDNEHEGLSHLAQMPFDAITNWNCLLLMRFYSAEMRFMNVFVSFMERSLFAFIILDTSSFYKRKDMRLTSFRSSRRVLSGRGFHIQSKKTGKRYIPAIGLEIHCQLKTPRKLFSGTYIRHRMVSITSYH
jgi:hypothetical protein